ncbi:MAG: hypothetical protein SPE13_02130, partial [Alloprevotella sp.]|nr:hypothetical protein [Alloprevotella sp.]
MVLLLKRAMHIRRTFFCRFRSEYTQFSPFRRLPRCGTPSDPSFYKDYSQSRGAGGSLPPETAGVSKA